MILNLSMNLSHPTLGDDNIRGLLKDWPLHDEIQQEVIYQNGYFKLISSNIEPVLAIKTDNDLYPILFQVREGGLSYSFYKLFLIIFSPKLALILVHFLTSSLTFFFIIKSLELIIAGKLFLITSLILAISPITIFNFGPYIADKFLHLFFWILIFTQLRGSSLKIQFLTAISGFLFKITFLWNILFAFGLNFNKDKLRYLVRLSLPKVVLILAFMALIPIFLWDQFSFELLQEHNFIKDFNFYVRFLTSTISQVISPALYLQYFTMTKGSLFLTILEIINLLVFITSIITCFVRKTSLQQLKPIFKALFLYYFIMLFAIYEGSNFSDFTSDIYPFILIITLTILSQASKRILNFYISSLVLISVFWHYDYWKNGPADEISYNFHEKVYKRARLLKKDGFIVDSKYDLGLVDFISNGDIKTSFFELNPNRSKVYKGTCLLKYKYQNWGKMRPISRSQISKQITDFRISRDSIVGKYNVPKADFKCIN